METAVDRKVWRTTPSVKRGTAGIFPRSYGGDWRSKRHKDRAHMLYAIGVQLARAPVMGMEVSKEETPRRLVANSLEEGAAVAHIPLLLD